MNKIFGDIAFSINNLTEKVLPVNADLVLIEDSEALYINKKVQVGTLKSAAGLGDVDGPASATDNALCRFDGVTGKLIQNSGVILDDSNNLIGLNSFGINTGAALPVTKLQVVDTVTSSPRGIMSSQYNIGAEGARFHMRKGRGTLAVPTTIVSGDNLGRLVASGYDGGSYQEMASIVFGTEGTIDTGRVPTNISLWTATNAAPSVLTQRLSINSAGLIESTNGNMQLTSTKTSIHNFTSANWAFTDGHWTMGATGPLVHVTGNTSTATATLTEAVDNTTPLTYKITITGTGGGGTAIYTFGGIPGTTIPASGAIAITDYITASTAASMIIYPTSLCTVSITSITIEKLTDATGDLTIEGNTYAKSPIFLHPGTAALPAIGFDTERTGINLNGVGTLGFVTIGTLRAFIDFNGLALKSDATQLRFGASYDAIIVRPAANSLAMRNGVNPQTFSLYETYTDASNYEIYSLDAGVTAADTLTIKAASLGTGSANMSIALVPKGTGLIKIAGCAISADVAGIASHNTLTNAVDTTTTNAYVVGGGQAATTKNTGWMKVYIGTAVAWIPYWTNATP